jgi:ElaB/YqjD/DUF883 family membrane-anchored ribosome-binding protein
MPCKSVRKKSEGNTLFFFFARLESVAGMRTKSGNGHNVDFEQLIEDLKTVVHDGEELLKAGVSTVKERALSGAQTTDRVVRENPYKSLGILFGVGLLLGVLATAMMTREQQSEDYERPL